jgi:predicted dehydrogenase
MSWEAALNDLEVFGVIIATPEKTHAELVQAALRSNKAVLVEKPATTTSESWQVCVDLATRNNLPLLVDYTFLHSQAFELWRSLEKKYSPELGEMKQLITTRKSQLTSERITGKALPIWWDVVIHDLYLLGALYDAIPTDWQVISAKLPSEIKASARFKTVDLIADYSWLALNPERSWLAHYEHGQVLWQRTFDGEAFEVMVNKKIVFSTTISDQSPSPLDVLIKKWLRMWNKENLAKLQKKHWKAVAQDIQALNEISEKLTIEVATH